MVPKIALVVIAVLNLGGTIALSYDEFGQHITLSGDQLVGDVPHDLIEVDPVQSNALRWEHLVALREQLQSIAHSGRREAIVITGTGTAEDVATFLAAVTPPPMRVALLVSFHPAVPGRRAPGFEAALAWATARSEAPSQIRLFVDGIGFNYPFEKRWGDRGWEFVSKSSDSQSPTWVAPTSCRLAPTMPIVPVVSAGIGAGNWIGSALNAFTADGFVVEGYGAGDVPPDVADHIVSYLDRGGDVVLVSLAHPGLVEPTYPGIPGTSHGLLAAGCLEAGLLSARHARIRLAVAIASGIADAPRLAFPASDR